MTSDTAEELSLLMRSGWRVVALESFEEARALSLIDQVARKLKRSCMTWSIASGLSPFGKQLEAGKRTSAGSFLAGLDAIAAHSDPAVFVVLDAHRVMDDPVAVRRLRDLSPVLATRKQLVVLLGPAIELPVELEREVARLTLPLPAEAEMHGLLQRVQAQIPQTQAEGSEELLARSVRGALGLTSAEAVKVFRKACQVTGGLNEATVSEVLGEKRRVLGRSAALSFHQDDSTLDEIGGLEELKSWLRERGRAFGEQARSFGLPIPRGLLLLGVQGCGKSLSAKSVAREWQFPLLRLDLAAAFGSAEQSPEMATREAMLVAESLAPVVLWVDEIEKGFSATDGDASASRVFGSFLTWLSEKTSPVFVVATANDVAGLPPELLRRGRFDELFFVDLPSPRERAEILAIHLRKRGREPEHYRVDELAAEADRLTGAELEQVVASALYSAFAQQRELEEDDLSNAITDAVPLYDTYEERIKELRDWARHRARPASVDGKVADFFRS
nr:AAA family ATPase [uncultured Brevundimonas sp.]